MLDGLEVYTVAACTSAGRCVEDGVRERVDVGVVTPLEARELLADDDEEEDVVVTARRRKRSVSPILKGSREDGG